MGITEILSKLTPEASSKQIETALAELEHYFSGLCSDGENSTLEQLEELAKALEPFSNTQTRNFFTETFSHPTAIAIVKAVKRVIGEGPILRIKVANETAELELSDSQTLSHCHEAVIGEIKAFRASLVPNDDDSW